MLNYIVKNYVLVLTLLVLNILFTVAVLYRFEIAAYPLLFGVLAVTDSTIIIWRFSGIIRSSS